MIRGAGCVSRARPDLWEPRAGDGPGPPDPTYLRVDVRAQVETHDGAYLYAQYLGLLEMNAAVQSAMASGGGTEFGDNAFYTDPHLETGDPRYAWLNTTFFVGEGRLLPGLGVECRIWRPA